ncbi:MAG: DUF305 domain-containing protein [Candidatus Zambryskibacteria bacterium]|nr:DUF305 domain-containing protein [Candidatus Zambryskibacteria bacterium]
MENNKVLLFSALFLIIGLFGGWFIAQNSTSKNTGPMGHMMPNGEMMMGDERMSMSQMMTDMNATLIGKTGDDFDKAFLTKMIVHHEGAVEMAQLALQNAKHQEIKDLAQEIIKAQNTEIVSMKSWLKNWYAL